MADRAASIIIPVGEYHRDVVDRAYQSAIHQTVPCDVLVIHDHDARGASWARNQGIAQAMSPFVVFLDADDELHPTFVEKTLRKWLELGAGAHYIYTDWRLPDGRIRYADECFDIFSIGMAHINTTLIALAAVYAAGGFDESLRGGEDEDFYARVRLAGMCHARVAEPMVEYHMDQGGSATNPMTNEDYPAAAAAIERRFRRVYGKYQGGKMGNCCGGGTEPRGQVPLNEPFEDAVLAIALYTPMKQTGPRSGIGYKRAGMGQKMYVHKDDVAARPDLWQIVPRVENLVPPQEDVLKLSGLV